MTHISRAALPPIQPPVHAKDREHPLFPIYQRYRNSMSAQLVEAASFENWLYSREREAREQSIMAHPRFKEWQQWMAAHKGGARPCMPTADMPRGYSFPNNFYYWLEGGRW